MFKEYTTSDEKLRSTDEVLDLMKTFLGAHDAVLNEVQFPASSAQTYVTAGNSAIKQAVVGVRRRDRRHAGAGGGGGEGADDSGDGGKEGGKSGGDGGEKPAEPVAGRGRDRADGAVRESDLEGEEPQAASRWCTSRSITRPCSRPGSTVSRDSRAFPIDGPKGATTATSSSSRLPGKGNGLITEYYGVSGTNWNDPPILENPSETRTIDGRDYLLFYDGDRLRLVGWKEGSEAYWVTNTLLQTLEAGQMLEIAKSMRKLSG